MTKVNPEILRWARESIGFTLDQAVRKLGIGDARGVSAVDRLVALETGDVEPTRPMLVKMARQYRRPLLAFYISAPPPRGDRGQDFRSLPANAFPETNAFLDVLIRNVSARQSTVRSVLEDEGDFEALDFVGSMDMAVGANTLQESIATTIGVSLAEFREQASPETAFSLLRSRTEASGIFVLLMSNLGSYHTSIELEVYRGFTLADDLAPFIVINDQDSKAAWSFTLLHELAHLWLGQTGVGGASVGQEVERFCNDVAGQFLLPEDELGQLEVDDWTDMEQSMSRVNEFATGRNLSSSLVTYKLFRSGIISAGTWNQLSTAFRDLWLEHRSAERSAVTNQDGGPDYYVVRRHRIGSALMSLVNRTMAEGSMTTMQAGRVLGIKARNVHRLLGLVGSGAGGPG